MSQRASLQLVGLLLLILAGGCRSEPAATIADATETANDVRKRLQIVYDPGTAQKAAPEIDKGMKRLIALIESVPRLVQQYRNARVRNGEAIMADYVNSMQQLRSEIQRVGRLGSLPAEFWNSLTVRLVDMTLAAYDVVQATGSPLCKEGKEVVEYLHQVRDAFEQHGYERVVQIEFTNLPENLVPAARDRLLAAAPGATFFHTAKGNINSTVLSSTVLAPVTDFRSLVAKLDFGTVIVDEPRRRLDIQVNRKALGARANSDAEEQRLLLEERRKYDEETHKRNEEFHRRIKEDIQSATSKHRKEELDPKDPNYYDKLADYLASDNPIHQSKAITVLLDTDPDEVSAETRKKIARAFKRLATGQRGHERGKAIRGLARWAGKFSVPILLEILEEEHSFVDDEVFKALGDLKDERAAAPVAARLGNFFQHDKAYKCLNRMGAVAEDAVLAVAPSSDPKVCLAAIQLLGEFGTDKSLKFLRTAAAKSRNPDVRFAAKAAVKRIIERRRASSEDKEGS